MYNLEILARSIAISRIENEDVVLGVFYRHDLPSSISESIAC